MQKVHIRICFWGDKPSANPPPHFHSHFRMLFFHKSLYKITYMGYQYKQHKQKKTKHTSIIDAKVMDLNQHLTKHRHRYWLPTHNVHLIISTCLVYHYFVHYFVIVACC